MNQRLTVLSLILWISTTALAQTRQLEGLPDQKTLDRFGLHYRWSRQVPLLRALEQVTTIRVIDGIVFAQTNQGILNAIDAETGKLMWSTTVGLTGADTFPPTVHKDIVYVTSGVLLTALDRATGRIQWSRDIPGVAISGTACNDEYVYYMGSDYRIYAIALKDDDNRKFTHHPIKWYYSLGAPPVDAPLVFNDRVVSASRDGIVYVTRLSSRELYYRYYTHSEIQAPLAALNGKLYIATSSNNLFAVNLANGRTEWRYQWAHPVNRRPIPFLEEVFVLPENEGLYSLETATGNVRWKNRDVSRVVSVSKDNVYGMSEYGDFLILSRQDGITRGRWPSRDFSIISHNQYNDRVYLSTSNGLVVCFHETINDKPLVHKQLIPVEKNMKKTLKGDTEAQQEKKRKVKGFFDDDDGKAPEPKEEKKKKSNDFFGESKKAAKKEKAEPEEKPAEDKPASKSKKSKLFEDE